MCHASNLTGKNTVAQGKIGVQDVVAESEKLNAENQRLEAAVNALKVFYHTR